MTEVIKSIVCFIRIVFV